MKMLPEQIALSNDNVTEPAFSLLRNIGTWNIHATVAVAAVVVGVVDAERVGKCAFQLSTRSASTTPPARAHAALSAGINH